MAFEALSRVQAAEERAAKTLADAASEAKRIVADAELKSRAAGDAAVEKAEGELAVLRSRCETLASENSIRIRGETETRKTVLAKCAEKRMEKAAMLIAERIVNA